MRHLIVVSNPQDWQLDISGVEVVSAKSYLTKETYSSIQNAKVYNLCRNYRYQSTGYYVSLLASARGHKPFPDVLAIQDLKSQTIVRIISDELDSLIQASLKPIQGDRFILSIYFGKNLAKRYDRLSYRLFLQFPAPLLRAEFIKKNDEWLLKSIHPVPARDIPENHKPFIAEVAQEFFTKRRIAVQRKKTRYDLAILVNPQESMPPSDEKALSRFIRAAEKLEFYVELITREDYGRINEFDALFIRETTSVNHHTYRLARRAAAEGLVVIDDPESILKCTNKVYLAELLKKNKVSAPRTVILNPDNFDKIQHQLDFPVILKQPDSSFSQGVTKADNLHQYKDQAKILFEKSDLLIAQEFIPTDFDWRVGILNQKPLYACKYFMARKHWQIYERSKGGKTYSGRAETMNLSDAPAEIIEIALKAASLIGNGLYGVDLKQKNDQIYVIEINDNPSIDAGYEDNKLEDELYSTIIAELLRRIEQLKERSPK